MDASTSNPDTAAATMTTKRVRGLLEARGVVAGPLYGPLHVVAGMVRMLDGAGVDTGGRRALGLLSNGDPGPIRTADFLVALDRSPGLWPCADLREDPALVTPVILEAHGNRSSSIIPVRSYH
jgi:hypothetical protein